MMISNVCNRCQEEIRKGQATTMSYFNEDTICMECKKQERAHPDFKRAQAAEHDEVRSGNHNFPGVGLPKDYVQVRLLRVSPRNQKCGGNSG
jgi:hypothetical protein